MALIWSRDGDAKIITPRTAAAIATDTSTGDVFMFGGYTRYPRAVATCERYNASTRDWVSVTAMMTIPRDNVAAIYIPHLKGSRQRKRISW